MIMGNESDENAKSHETVTLILKTERFKVEKLKLINKSQYFAALLSPYYLECHQTEHIINYDISPISLQDFINWIHSDKIDISVINDDIKEFDRFLILLELSILFAADNLTEDVTDRLEKHYMSPKYVINIWLLTQELNVNVLRDLSLAVCLDRFDELPLSSIYELSKENFLKLIGNINIRSTESYLSRVIHEWMNHHCDFTISVDILKNKEIKVLHSIISCESSDIINSEQFIHCWDGNDFFELTSFKYPKDIIDHSTGKNILTGMQIIGRRYDLYLCGGEFGIGSCRFNKNIWRYSLIAKKWFLETIMPVERRHMVAVFLKNKLVLVGGVGRYRQKLQTVDIYDIHTGLWTSGKQMGSWKFTTVPEHYIFDEKLIIYDTHWSSSDLILWCNIYFPDEDMWKTRSTSYRILCNDDNLFIPVLTVNTVPCYIDINNPNEMILRTIKRTTCDIEGCNHIRKITCLSHIDRDDSNYNFKREFEVFKNTYIFSLILPCVHVLICSYLYAFETLDVSKILHLHNIPIRNSNKFRSFLFSHSPRRFFNLIHPAHLHMTNLIHI